MSGCCLSGLSYILTIIKKSVIPGKDSVNLEITYMENLLSSMSNHYPRFPDFSALITPMSMNYYECIIYSVVHRDRSRWPPDRE